jgi:cytoskeletal protein CcmA (bactofilin family)
MGCYSKFARRRDLVSMVWFDRNVGGKKDAEAEEPQRAPEPVKTASQPVPIPLAAESNGPAKMEVASQPAESGLVGYLYKGCRISGQLTFQGAARIEGNVDGEIHCHGTLTIGEGAEVRAKISGQVVTIRGRVEGNVTAKEKVELIAPARLYGNIDAPRLVITEGVVFDGDCSMGVAKQKGGVASSNSVSADQAAAAQAPLLDPGSDN